MMLLQKAAENLPTRAPGRRYLLITPCRDEARYARRTIESIVRQTVHPAMWIIVDDGSTDQTPELLEEFERQVPWIRVVRLPDRGFRQLGAGVIHAFYEGYKTVNPDEFDFLCKLDLDIELPPRYFERLMDRMEQDPRIGTASGKPWFGDRPGHRTSEMCGDENSVGMAKFYRTACFKQIGGFVPQLMWDGIDGHRCRMLGWIAVSWNDPELNFQHLRPMGTSHKSWWNGRVRHGVGQYFMGTSPLYMLASAAYRMTRPPLILGGVAMLWGYLKSWMGGLPRYSDAAFREFLRRYQRQCLVLGKRRATDRLNQRQLSRWNSEACALSAVPAIRSS